MNRNVILGTGAAVVIAAGSLVAATSASAGSSSHTLHLKAKVLKTVETSKSTSVETDVLRKAGKTVGFETQSCNFGGTSDACAVTFALKNGTLIGATTSPISQSSSVKYKGKITGGRGKYAGDKGTIAVSATGARAKLTIVYG